MEGMEATDSGSSVLASTMRACVAVPDRQRQARLAPLGPGWRNAECGRLGPPGAQRGSGNRFPLGFDVFPSTSPGAAFRSSGSGRSLI